MSLQGPVPGEQPPPEGGASASRKAVVLPGVSCAGKAQAKAAEPAAAPSQPPPEGGASASRKAVVLHGVTCAGQAKAKAAEPPASSSTEGECTLGRLRLTLYVLYIFRRRPKGGGSCSSHAVAAPAAATGASSGVYLAGRHLQRLILERLASRKAWPEGPAGRRETV